MMNTRKSLRKKLSGTSAPIASFALAALLCAGVPGRAQDAQGQSNNNMNMQGPASMQAPNPDVTPRELASLNQFLESHPELAEQIRKDPALVNNQEYVEDHPALQQYLQEHPEVREEIRENPNAFMRQEERFDRREDGSGQTKRLAATDEFLESHPEIAEQIRKDPSLVNDPQFVQQHPALQQFLQEHPEIREQLQSNPNAFLQQEQRFDRQEDRFGQTKRLAATDEFFESHPEIAEQIRKDPSLVNNPRFVQDHPALQQFLQEHPEIREQLQSNPNAFLQQEQRFDRREDRKGMAVTDQFFDSHPEIAEQLHKDPSLVNNQKFVQDHPALQQYLQQHPEIREEFKANPNAFMQQEQRFDRREDMPGQPGRMAVTDRFLDSHPEIAEQLQKDPSLVNNQHFVQSHAALQQYLQEHPEIRQQFQQNPSAFMQQQQRFEQREDGQQGASFGQFLGSHAGIAHQLSQNPSLVNNKEYLEDHPDLQQYLKAHPETKQEFSENPGAFMSALESGAAMPGSASTPSTKSAGTASKPKP